VRRGARKVSGPLFIRRTSDSQALYFWVRASERKPFSLRLAAWLEGKGSPTDQRGGGRKRCGRWNNVVAWLVTVLVGCPLCWARFIARGYLSLFPPFSFFHSLPQTDLSSAATRTGTDSHVRRIKMRASDHIFRGQERWRV